MKCASSYLNAKNEQIFFCQFKKFRRFQLSRHFNVHHLLLIKQNDELIKFIENFQMNQKYLNRLNAHEVK